jgi:mycothiol synthase
MKATMRTFENQEDYWRIRPFLREVFLLNGRRELSWQVARWDYWRWPGVESWGDGPLEGRVFIWELSDSRIAAVLNPEGKGEAFLQVHPDLRTAELETEMVAVAERHLAVRGSGGQRSLGVWADADDAPRQDILERSGYTRDGSGEHQYRRSLSKPIPDTPVMEGYTVRALGDVDELPARSWFSWRAFNPDEPKKSYAALGWEWYLDIQRCPLYRRDLDIVAVAPNGDLAAFCTVWYDDVTRCAYFEPVGTYTPYQRRGLGKAVMCEGLRRAERLGATLATVGGYSPEANALYTSVMGQAHALSERWVKLL